MCKNLNHIRLVTNNQRAKKIGQVQTKVSRKYHRLGFTKCCKITSDLQNVAKEQHPTVVLAWPDSA